MAQIVDVLNLINAARASTSVSWVSQGLIYEKLAGHALSRRFQKLGMHSFQHIGRSGDRGVDFIAKLGQISVQVQCKSSMKKPSGAIWRDLSGIHGLNAPYKTLMVLVTPVPMTGQAHVEFSSSRSPLMHCVVPKVSVRATDQVNIAELTRINACVLNSRARKLLESEGLLDSYFKSGQD